MPTGAECIFCSIVGGRAPSTTIARTDRAIAFMDIQPVTPGHALVIPRAHSADLFDIDPDDLAACGALAQVVARRATERLGADGVNLLNCSGPAAWQTVFHVHLHVIPRYADQPDKDRIGPPWTTVPSSSEEIARIGALLT